MPKAMILAAGLGTRLRPLTYKTPKPLLPVGGCPIIEYNLKLIRDAGIDDVIINLHHLGNMIEDYIGNGSRYGLNITYSHEPEILGTGGGIKKAENFFGRAPFIVINSDILMDIDIGKLIEAHHSKDSIATLVLRPMTETEKYTPVSVRAGHVESFGECGNHSFTGLQVIEPELLSFIPPAGFACMVQDGYIPALNAGKKISAYIHDGYWMDLGTHKSYKSIQRDIKEIRKFISLR